MGESMSASSEKGKGGVTEYDGLREVHCAVFTGDTIAMATSRDFSLPLLGETRPLVWARQGEII